MKKLLLTTAFVAMSFSAHAEILAKVNGRPITRAEVEMSLAEVATMEDGADPKLEAFPIDFQRAFVDKYIEKLLIIDEARKSGVAKDPEVIAEVRGFEDNLIQQKYLTDLVIKQRSDKKLREIYAEKFKAKEGKQEIHASHILVKSEDEAKKIKKELDGGADFDELADRYSIDPGAKISSGDLGYFTEDEKVAAFSKPAFAMKKGEVSGPIKSDFGWHIIKVYDKRTFRAPAYAEAISEIEGSLATDVIDNEVNKLKTSARVEYLGPFAGKPTIVKKAPLKPNNLAAESTLPDGEKAKLSVPKPLTATTATIAKPTEPKPVVKTEIKALEPKPVVNKPAVSKPVAAMPDVRVGKPPVTVSGGSAPVKPAEKASVEKPATVKNSNLKSGSAAPSSPVEPVESAKD